MSWVTTTVPKAARTGNEESGPPTPHLFRLHGSDDPLAPSSRHVLHNDDVVLIGRGKQCVVERCKEAEASVRMLMPDPCMSVTHARLTRQQGMWQIEDLGSTNGILIDGRRVTLAPLQTGDLIEVGNTFFLFRDDAAAQPGAPDLDSSQLVLPARGLATLSTRLAREFADLLLIAASDLPILLRGEPGTGKEVTAQAIHAASQRKGAFIPVNCGALPESLVEGELFGYRRGAFSGAERDHDGMVRAAARGTLFLDEIADLRPPSQAALLRLLQEREVTPLGAARPVKVDVRIIAATNRDLEEMVEDGRFRDDLLARLSGHVVWLPELAERREDLGLLVAALIARLADRRASRIRFTADASRAIFLHDWPNNVRELEMCLAAAILKARDDLVVPRLLPDAVRAALTAGRRWHDSNAGQRDDDALRGQLAALLDEHQGNVSAIARAMGKARVQVQRWMKRYGLDRRSYRRPDPG